MPTYEYKCSACGYAFERFHSMSATPVKKCPECGKSKVKRLLGTGAGLIFKGSGFYITDYRSDSYAEAAKKDSGTGTETKSDDNKSTGGETKTEAKPAAETKPAATESKSSSAKKSSPSKPSSSAPSKKKK